MSAIPSSAIGNLIVHVAQKHLSGSQMLTDETKEFVIAVEEILEKHKKTVRPQVVGYVLAAFAHKLKGIKEWPKEP